MAEVEMLESEQMSEQEPKPEEEPNIHQELPILELYEILSRKCEGTDYLDNLFGFWFMDMVAEAMYQLKFPPLEQQTLLSWFKYLYNMIHKRHQRRKQVFEELRNAILNCTEQLHNHLPKPPSTFEGPIGEPVIQQLSSAHILDSLERIVRSSELLATSSQKITSSERVAKSIEAIHNSSAMIKNSSERALYSTNKVIKSSEISGKSSSMTKKSSVRMNTVEQVIPEASASSYDVSMLTENVISPSQSTEKALQELNMAEVLQEFTEKLRRNSGNIEKYLKDFVAILEVLYSVFANPFCYSLIDTALHTSLQTSVMSFPFGITVSMGLKPPPEQEAKLEKKEKSEEKEKGEKQGKGSKKEKGDKNEKGGKKEKRDKKEKGANKEKGVKKEKGDKNERSAKKEKEDTETGKEEVDQDEKESEDDAETPEKKGKGDKKGMNKQIEKKGKVEKEEKKLKKEKEDMKGKKAEKEKESNIIEDEAEVVEPPMEVPQQTEQEKQKKALAAAAYELLMAQRIPSVRVEEPSSVLPLTVAVDDNFFEDLFKLELETKDKKKEKNVKKLEKTGGKDKGGKKGAKKGKRSK